MAINLPRPMNEMAAHRQPDWSLGMSNDPTLPELLAARLCHDLGGAVGTLAGTLDLVEGHGGEMLELARETSVALRDRLRLYSVAWGGGAEPSGRSALIELLKGSSASPRVQFSLDGFAADAVLPATLVPLALNAALLAVDALPAGGLVHLAGDPDGLTVLAEGRRAGWPAEVLAGFSGAPLTDLFAAGPRRVLVPLLLGQLARAGWRAALALGPDDAGAAPLLLTPA